MDENTTEELEAELVRRGRPPRLKYSELREEAKRLTGEVEGVRRYGDEGIQARLAEYDERHGKPRT